MLDCKTACSNLENTPQDEQEIFYRPERLDLYVNMLEIFLEWAASVPEIAGVENKDEEQTLPELEHPIYRARLIKAYGRIVAEYLKLQLLKGEG